MPNLGYETIGVGIRNINGTARGSVFAMPENGTLQSVTAYIEDAATGDTFSAVIYDATVLTAATLVEGSTTRTNISTAGWYTFTFAGTSSLVSGTSYYIGVGSNSATDANVYHDAGTGYVIFSYNPSSPAATEDLNFGADARIYSTYLTYTATGGTTVTWVGYIG